MRHGMSPKDAALDALKRVVRNFDNDMERLAKVDLTFYVMSKDGEYCGASLWDRSQAGQAGHAICGMQGRRPEPPRNCVYLLERRA